MGVPTEQLNYDWSYQIAHRLYELGVRTVCISPGSRNTPLTLAFLDYKQFNCISHIDERSAGFFALGCSLYNQSPAVLISTSGTATANYLPSIVEANQSKIPLIILTADRPPQLVGTGANQTINQKNIYGYHIRQFVDIGLPQEITTKLDSDINSIYQLSMGKNWSGKSVSPSGPVHVNIPFDEPLYLQNRKASEVGKEVLHPFPMSVDIEPKFKIQDVKFLLLVCGRLSKPIEGILEFAEQINAPVFVDPLSQMRFGYEHPNLISSYDMFLDSVHINPDLIIRFGAKPVSKKLNSLLDEWNQKSILIDESGRFNDDCSQVISENFEDAMNSISNQIKLSNNKWVTSIKEIDNKTKKFIQNYISDKWFEGSIAQLCLSSMKEDCNFVVGNSMPIRDVDMFGNGHDAKINVFSNRGASGIDGINSTALGIAHQSDKKTLLLIGDLSFIHDMNGLLTAHRYNINLTIVVVNNNGGGIFSFLPISQENNKTFNEFWTTPHGVEISKIASMYNFEYSKVDSCKSLSLALEKQQNGVHIIEAESSINENVDFHQRVKKELKQFLSTS